MIDLIHELRKFWMTCETCVLSYELRKIKFVFGTFLVLSQLTGVSKTC